MKDRPGLLLWLLWTVAIAALAIGLWWAAGPWSVHVYGQSYGCGSAFVGLNRSTNVDAAAQQTYACFLQASNRRLLAYVFGALGIATFVAALAMSLIRSARQTEDTRSPFE